MSKSSSIKRTKLGQFAASVVGVLGTVALLAGCGAGAGNSPAASEGYTPPSKSLSANITYALWDQSHVNAIHARTIPMASPPPALSSSETRICDADGMTP